MRITRSLTSSTSAGRVDRVIATLWICLRALCGSGMSAEPVAEPPAVRGAAASGAGDFADPDELATLPASSSLPWFAVDASPMIATKTTITAPTAEIACRFGRTVCHCHERRGGGGPPSPPPPGRGGEEPPPPPRRSSFPTQAGAGSGRTARTSASRSKGSGIEGLPELGHGAVDERAGVGHADADQLGDLGVGELRVVPERDQLALARAELAERDAHRLLLRGQLRRLAGIGLGGRNRQRRRRHALAPAKLVQRRVARDPEQPRARASLAGVVAAPAPVGALE